MNFTTKQRKFVGLGTISVKSHLVCVKMKKIHKIIQVWENTPTECKSCITINRCKNNIFCKYYTHCVDNTPLCNTKVCIVTHVVQITHKVQDYTLICCIACTVWYRVCQITTQYSVNFCLLSGKIYTGQKNLHGRRPWRP